MKIKCAKPYLTLHGIVKGINPEDPDMRFYFRTNKQTGEVIACKCPTFTKPPSAAQLANRKRFVETYGRVARHPNKRRASVGG